MSQPPSPLVINEAMLPAWFDPATIARGRAYADQERVLGMGPVLNSACTASVLGSGDAVYRVRVQMPTNAGPPRLSTNCTCPIQFYCKHAVALLFVIAWRAKAEANGTIETARWRRQLDQALGIYPEYDLTPSQHMAPRRLGVVLVVSNNRHGGDATITLNPVIQGRRDQWVKSGASWIDIVNMSNLPSHRDPVDRAQVQALAEIPRLMRGGYSYYGTTDYVDFAGLGQYWPGLLASALAAGVEIMYASAGGPPIALRPPGAAYIHVTPPDGGAAGEIAFRRPLPDLTEGLEIGDGGIDFDLHTIRDANQRVTGWLAVGEGIHRLIPAATPVPAGLARLLDRAPIEVPEEDWDEALLTRLPELARQLPVVAADGYEVPIFAPALLIEAHHGPGHRAEVFVGFLYRRGESETGPSVPLTASADAFRDLRAERELMTELDELLDEFPLLRELIDRQRGVLLRSRDPDVPIILHGRDLIGLSSLLLALRGSYNDVVVRERGEPIAYLEAANPPTILLSTTDSDERDWFELNVTVRVEDEEVAIADLIAALATGDEILMLPSGTWFQLDRPELQQLRAILDEAKALQDKESEGLRLSIVQAGLWEELVSLGVVESQSMRWQTAVDRLTGVVVPESIEMPEGIDAQLRPYQLDGLRWMATLWEAGLGGILADDMGLGKTLQMLAMLQRAKEAGGVGKPALIVCPTSVMSTWVSEAAKFAPGLRVAPLTQTRAKARVPLADVIADHDVVVTSYAVMRIDRDVLAAEEWSVLILDEAQFVKNYRSQGYAAARRIPAQRTFALTGTPLENSLMDLWALLSLTAPGLYPRPDTFKDLYQKPIESGADPERLATLRRRIRPLMLRRTKDAVAKELPPRQEQVLTIDLGTKHRTIYDRHLARERQRLLGLLDDLQGNRIKILAALTMLRQLAIDPSLVDDAYATVHPVAKLEELVTQLTELSAEGHRVLVFSQFTKFLRKVRERLTLEGISTSYLDGRTRNRDAVLAGWRTGDDAAFLISLKAGGFGLTLTEADYVFVLDPWWNPAAEMQAVDRAHRIGQTKPVHVYRLVSADTIEEKVVALQQRKRELFEKVVDDGAITTGALTADDLRDLLNP